MVVMDTRPEHQLKEELEALLTNLGVSIEDYAQRAALGTLADEEWDARDRMVTLLFLTGSDIRID